MLAYLPSSFSLSKHGHVVSLKGQDLDYLQHVTHMIAWSVLACRANTNVASHQNPSGDNSESPPRLHQSAKLERH